MPMGRSRLPLCLLVTIVVFFSINGLAAASNPGSWGNPCLTVEKLQKQAEEGNANAQSKLGQLYAPIPGAPEMAPNESCLKKDAQLAVKWLTQAGEGGHSQSALMVGVMYENGWGIPKNIKKAEHWFGKAASLGDSKGMIALGHLYSQEEDKLSDHQAAREWYEKAWAKGDSEAAFYISKLYEKELGIPKDEKMAVDWLQKAVKGGWTQAIYELGLRHVNGQGITQDKESGLALIRKASARRYPDALIWWGKALIKGKDIPADPAQARKLLDRAFIGTIVAGQTENTQNLLLEGFADANAYGSRPIYMPDPEKMMEMMRSGKGPEVEQVPVLGMAAESGHEEIVKLLIEHGAKVNAKRTKTRKTALWSAAKYGHDNIVKILLKAGADPNPPADDFEGGAQTPLEVARAKNQSKVVQALQAVKAIGRSLFKKTEPENKIDKVDIEYRVLETDHKLTLEETKARLIATPLPDSLQTMLAEAKMPMPSSSPWIETEKALYQEVVKSETYDVLVVPVQVQYFGIDATGRSQMTHYLVDELRKTTPLRMPNPMMVSKALGEYARTYDREHVYRLANDLKVGTIVWGYVGHDRSSEMRVTIQLQAKDKSGLHASTPIIQWDAGPIEISDEVLPEVAFTKVMGHVVEHLSKENEKPKSAGSSTVKEKSLEFPSSPMSVVQGKPESSIMAAYHLQLLGALYPRYTERSREYLFERSLLALNGVNKRSPEYPILKARALLYLHRRPAALKALEGIKTPEAKALRAVLNGNLPEAEQEIANIQSPLKKVLAQFEVADLRYEYGGTELQANEYEEIAKRFPGWEVLIVERLHDRDPWHHDSNIPIKILLDQAFPIPGKSMQTQIENQRILNSGGLDSQKMEMLAMSHVREALKRDPKRWCCMKEFGTPHEWDYLNLLASLADVNVIKSVLVKMDMQGNLEGAKRLIDDYITVYEGHPVWLSLRARNLFERLEAKKELDPNQVQQPYVADIGMAVLWAGGQTEFAAEALRNSFLGWAYFKKAQLNYHPIQFAWYQWYANEFPRRGYWSPFETPHRVMDPKYDKNLAESLKYSTTNLWNLQALYERSPAEAPAQDVYEANRHRFNGHPGRLAFIAQVETKEDDTKRVAQLYEVAIRKKVQEWEPYWELGSLYIKEGQFEKAKQALKKYPGFQIKDPPNPVALSNHAYYAGSLLFWRGAYQDAEPFYQFSADLQTGSSASLTSAARMALVKGEYLKSAKIFRMRATSYHDRYAYRDYLTLLHLLGFSKEAWSGFNGLLGQFERPSIWTSAFVGHRFQGSTPEQITEWLRGQQEKRAHHAYRSFPARFALMANIVDRYPTQDMIDLIGELEKGYEVQVTSLGNVMNKANELVGPSDYKGFRQRPLNLKKNPESELVLFAKGYRALRKKDYGQAMEWFEERARYYTYRSDDYGGYALPYFTWASVKNGNARDIKLLLENYEKPDHMRRYEKEFDYYLAQAFMAGGENRHKEAVTNLKAAFNRRPHTEMRPIFSWYQIVEACEWLYEETKQKEYRDLAVKWAKDYQVIQPMFAWAYAVEVKYAKDASARQRALGFALYLDRNSERIAGISKTEKDKARDWFKRNNPFIIKPKAVRNAA